MVAYSFPYLAKNGFQQITWSANTVIINACDASVGIFRNN